MPEISRFYGIIILMYYNNHNPPHFHAVYGNYEIAIDIETGLVRGVMPKRALSMVLEWSEKRHSELLENWDLAQKREPLDKISPLD
jgi:hypothetical protein